MPDYNINLTIQNIWAVLRVAVDIGILWFLIYYAIKFVRNNSRTVQIFKGIIIIVIVNAIAKLLGLATVSSITNTIISWGFLSVIIVFQPEIRSFLERIGKTNAFSKINTLLADEKEKLANEVYEATVSLSKQKIGALIAIEQSQSMQDYISTGITINASVKKELLCSIFMTTTPLHDGAVIIQGDKVSCASAYFPPTSVNLSSRYGARHRAALGISEVTDCLAVVVSEETSAISIAEKGRIFTVNEKQLKDYLKRVICGEEIEISKQSEKRNSLSVEDEEFEINDKDGNSIFGKASMKLPFNNRNKFMEKNKKEETKVDIVEDDAIEIKDNTKEDDNVK